MKKLSFLMLFILFCISANAITLDECRDLAKQNYPIIKQYQLIERSTEFSVANARRGYIPQLSFSAQASYQSDVVNFSDEMKTLFSIMGINYKGINKDQYKIALDLNQPIWDGGTSKVKRLAAESQGDISTKSTDIEMYAITDRVNSLYFGVLLMQAQHKNNLVLQELLNSSIKKVESYVKNGVATVGDLSSIQAELLTAKQKETEIVSSAKAYADMLSLFIGKAVKQEELVLPQPEKELTKEILRPELQLFDLKGQELKVRKTELKSISNPKISLYAQGFYGNPGLNMFKDMMENKWTLNGIIGIRFQWSLTPYYTRKNEIKKITLAQKQIDSQRDTFLFNTNLQITQQEREITKMRSIMEKDNEIVILREKVRMDAESKLQNGIIYVSDLLQEITRENQAQILKSIHEIELIKEIYELQFITNSK